jgi:LPS sulfotransferase NodH
LSDLQVIDNSPFFLVGCVRSGTTLLRNLLRQHPRLESPEETHYFRWADPFGSDPYRRLYRNSPLLKRHRALDGIDEEQFQQTLDSSGSRRQLMDTYGAEFLKCRQNPDGRWFDKTPQNVYGTLLISAAYPEARFVHLHRHPLNVVASLMEGAVMPVHSLDAAINYWVEAVGILEQFKRIATDRLLEISYESLSGDPLPTVSKILEFIGEDPEAYPGYKPNVHPERNKYREKLSAAQVDQVLKGTAPYLDRYGYDGSV